LAFVAAVHLFHPATSVTAGIHETAVIGKNCKIDPSVSIGPYCVIEENVTIGPKTRLMANVVVGEGSVIGEDCVLNRHVTLYHDVSLGSRVMLHSGVVVGADGFGFTQSQGHWIKVPQIGRVVIEDDVEIGANSAVDRGALTDTIIHKGVKIDNLVQIAHNVEIGEHTIIAGCVAIAGSVKIGKHCMIGGACNISGHLTIADWVVLTGTASVVSSIEEAGIYSSGINARPHREWVKTVIRLGQLNEIEKRIKQLEKCCYERNE
jgi:UDP-3-O-[3-hydroxymyristoyl] glucosamine N-acyltransferase